jgi:hypothetical protein
VSWQSRRAVGCERAAALLHATCSRAEDALKNWRTPAAVRGRTSAGVADHDTSPLPPMRLRGDFDSDTERFFLRHADIPPIGATWAFARNVWRRIRRRHVQDALLAAFRLADHPTHRCGRHEVVHRFLRSAAHAGGRSRRGRCHSRSCPGRMRRLAGTSIRSSPFGRGDVVHARLASCDWAAVAGACG